MSNQWPPGRLAAAGLPFVLIVFTAFNGGGYDALVRGQLGLVIWWLVLLGGLLGLIRLKGIGRPALAALVLLAGLAGWTAASALWSDSPGSSISEAARVVTYLGVFVLALALAGAGEKRLLLGSVAAGIGVVGAVAVFSRLHPQWFEVSEQIAFLSEADERLSYPLNYWNGVATLIALGLPLLLYYATEAKSRWVQMVAAASFPALVLGVFLTFSRGGSLSVAVGLAVFLTLHPRRLQVLPTVLWVGLLAGVLVAAADAREAFADGLREGEGLSQANEMLAFTVVACVASAAGRLFLSRAESRRWFSGLTVPRRIAIWVSGAAVLAIATITLAFGGTDYATDRWDDFKSSTPGTTGADRLSSASGSGRYQWWSAAIEAGKSEPITGIGAGAYEHWWLRTRPIDGFIRDAHSLYLESFGELGLVGALLVLGLIGTPLVVGAGRALGSSIADRKLFGAGAATLATFAFAALGDWVWEQPVLVFVFLFTVATLLAGNRGTPPPPRRASRIVLASSAVLALAVISLPLLGEHYLRESREHARGQDLEAALEDAQRAVDIQPYAADAHLQEALVLELMGELDAAAEAAEEATERAETNWQTWVVLSRIEWERGNDEELELAYERARELNPRSPLFD